MTRLKTVDYVIRYDGAVKSYFADWTRPAAIPRFGAKLKDTPRYASEDAARAEINRMPATASIMCEVKAVMARKPRKS